MVLDEPQSPTDRSIVFGPFRLIPSLRLLVEGDKPVRLGSRAFDLLTALIERAGEIVSKEDLIARVWPDTFVEEGNIRVHIAALRRALGESHDGGRYVVTVPGRGYSFVAEVAFTEEPASYRPRAAPPVRGSAFPLLHQRVIGREETVRLVATRLRESRFITIVGPGGIGKTTVALAVAAELAETFRQDIRFTDLAAVTDPRLAPAAVAASLGVRAEDGVPERLAALSSGEVLLLIDNCEHIVEAAAQLCEAIHKAAPRVHILATSREPLRARGEHVFRLGSLELPPESAGVSSAEAMRSAAVQLFVERAAAGNTSFELTDSDAPIVAEICRRLDGVALAIELAAGRVEVFGIAGLRDRLGDRLRLLSHGRRTALPRHKTLAATIDWSYQLLPVDERVVFMRLSVFAASFTLDAAVAIAADDTISSVQVVDCVAELVAKSLIAAGGVVIEYRLQESTRAFAFDKLALSGELDRVTRRHVEFLQRQNEPVTMLPFTP